MIVPFFVPFIHYYLYIQLQIEEVYEYLNKNEIHTDIQI